MSEYRLVPMRESDYEFWVARTRAEYRDEKMKANGYTFEEATRISEESFQKLLPQGLKTRDHYLFTVRDSSDQVLGYVWYAMQGALDNRKAFIYDIVIEAPMRGKGVGRAAMKLLEVEARKTGARAIGLHVFGHNRTAIHLYESLEYRTTDLVMEKLL